MDKKPPTPLKDYFAKIVEAYGVNGLLVIGYILATYDDRTLPNHVLFLHGGKATGKTILAKAIAKLCVNQGSAHKEPLPISFIHDPEWQLATNKGTYLVFDSIGGKNKAEMEFLSMRLLSPALRGYVNVWIGGHELAGCSISSAVVATHQLDLWAAVRPHVLTVELNRKKYTQETSIAALQLEAMNPDSSDIHQLSQFTKSKHPTKDIYQEIDKCKRQNFNKFYPEDERNFFYRRSRNYADWSAVYTALKVWAKHTDLIDLSQFRLSTIFNRLVAKQKTSFCNPGTPDDLPF